jgi:hypothetical protein
MSLDDLVQLNTVTFILNQPVMSARAGNRVEFHGFLANFTDTDVTLGGYSAGIIVPGGLHGSAFPFSPNPAFPQTLSRLSLFGPTLLFSIEISYGSVRPSDQFLIGNASPVYKDAGDTTEGNFRAGLPALFQITLTP